LIFADGLIGFYIMDKEDIFVFFSKKCFEKINFWNIIPKEGIA